MNQQLSGTENANYPASAFPNLATWRYDKKKDAGLNGYGTWVAIDVQIKGRQQLISAKISRPVSLLTQEANSIGLSPLQDSVVLCDSSHTSDNFPVGCNNFVPKQLKSKIIDKKLPFTALPVENKFLNFVDGAPQVFIKECKDSLKKILRDDSLRGWMRHIFEKKLSQDTFLKHFDPTCFGAGRKLLSDLLQEDYKKSLTEEMNEGGTVGGGCLSYKDISKTGCKNLGILICAQGLGMDELSIKAIHADGASKIQLCGDISRTLNGRIQNINSATFAGDTMISAMSNYNALVNNFHSDSIDFNWEEKKAQFSENSLCSTSGLSTSGDAPFSSVVINPYIQGECVVATKNGCAGVWRADRQSQTDSFNAVLRLNVCYAGENVSLKQISFGAHPRQFCACDHYRTYLFDIRSQNSPCCFFDVQNSLFLDKSEFIYSAQTCQSLGNEYEVIVATDNNIFLFDQRHPNQPLLQFDAASNFPASYLKCVRSTFDECTSDIQGSDIQLSNSLVLAGGMTTDIVHYWQLNRQKTICSDGKYLCSPPYLAAPTRILSPLPIKHSTLSTKLASSVSSNTNCSYVIKGFDASVFDGARSKHVCIFQLTSRGEIIYQHFGKNDKTVESFQNFRSDGNSLISHDIISQSDIPTTSNSSMINNSNDAVNRCISSARGMKHCVICESESLSSSIVSDSNDDHDASLPTIFKSCKHRSLLDGSRIEYSIEDKYFHSTNDISQLNLIDTDSPSDASDMGRMLLESW